jgi:signal transduction histidine kinase/ligand-binding sensor domain-containing protein/DNA-binding response OmpR family regulator
MKASYFTCLILLGIVLDLLAQQGQFKFNRLDIDKGLSHNTIRCFYKDKQGFMWIGTVSGLNRFDGVNLKIFQNVPGDSSSISDNEVLNIFEDPEGNIWLNTWSGTSIYNPSTERFHHDTQKFLQKYSIPSGSIADIKKDTENNYWFIHSKGLYLFKPSSGKTLAFIHNPNDTSSIDDTAISTISADGKENVWIIHNNGLLELLNKKNGSVIYRNPFLRNKYSHESTVYNLMVDTDGDLWIYMNNNNKGVFYFKHTSKTFSQISQNGTFYKLNNNLIRGIVQDDKGIIWIATDHGGINLVDKHKNEVSYLLHNPDDDQSLVQNSVNTIYKDSEGFIWTGTYKKGVSYYHENLIRFPVFRYDANNPSSLPFNDINCFEEDEKGNIWIGTNGGGLVYYDRKNNTYHSYVNDPRNESSLSNNVIVSLCLDHENKLWIGTFFGGLNVFDGKIFRRFKSSSKQNSSIADDSIWEIFEDDKNDIWIGTLSGGLDRYDRATNSFIHYGSGTINSPRARYVPTLLQDHNGNMWIGTGDGLVMRKDDGTFVTYLHNPDDPQSLSHNRILCLIQDKRGLFWIGTKEGLNVFNAEKKEFKLFRKEDGLPHNTIHTLLEDAQGQIWIGTPNGLSNLSLNFDNDLSIQSFAFKNFDASDGLQGKQFNEGAAFKTREGELLFGGSNGFNAFNADVINSNTSLPTVVLTDFQLFNKSVKPGTEVNGRIILNATITRSKSITLAHSQNLFSIEFAALSFFHPEKIKYRYKLEGFNNDWLVADNNSRKVTYTNLDAGDYTFVAMASNNDGIWSDKNVTLKITVLPPFWKSKIAFAIYAFAMLGALGLARRIILQRERLKFQIEQEHKEAERIQALDAMKTKFFTNVSHEFRTPLTLILTPLEKIINETKDSAQSKQLQLVSRNARRLLNLVNQLLDLRRLEVQEIKYNSSEGDIVKFINDTIHSFTDLSEAKNIHFSWHTNIDQLETIFDRDKLERILFNLLSNAFKFTPDGGAVSVTVSRAQENAAWVEIKVQDTGIGIPEDKQKKVFERFFQADMPTNMVNQGSGIGLSITNEFVKIHGGSISLQSIVGQGSCFTIILPVKPINASPGIDVISEVQDRPSAESIDTSKPVLLLVEDNEDFRFYLKDNLKTHYVIEEADNGKTGLLKAQTIIPDLIVSDVMMPVMSGTEMCKRIKRDAPTSHIPIILLTARSTEDQKLEGLETGADDYITKPFNFEILQLRIKNLIQQRELFHKDFRKQIEVKASSINISSLDEKLIKKAIELVESQISNADFSVEDLSRELAMSRVHLYKKLISLTGKSPLEFIRVIRLQRAAQLLAKSQLTVAEVAYQVGFNNPKYFARYFKEEYKVLPSAYSAAKQ